MNPKQAPRGTSFRAAEPVKRTEVSAEFRRALRQVKTGRATPQRGGGYPTRGSGSR